MSQVFNRLYEFGGFRLDPAERLLWHGEETLILPPKVFDTLLVLLEKDGRVVSKSELMEAIWGDTFIEESNRSQNIYTLRRTLGVDEQGRQFIETVPRRGYRFAAPVSVSGEGANDSSAIQGAEVEAKPARPAEVPAHSGKPDALLPFIENLLNTPALPPSTNDSQTAAATQTPPQTPVSPSPLPSSEQTRRPSASSIGLWAGLGVLLLLALSSGVYQLVTADGRMLVARQQSIVSHLWALPDGDVKKARQLTFGGRNFDGYVGLAWTPDDRIIFSARSDHVTDLYSMNADGGNRVQLTENAGLDNSFPVVSADGRYIIFISNRSGTRQIWRMNSDGRNPKQLTFGETDSESALYAAVSPDSREAFFIKYGSGPATIWKTPIEGGTAAPVSPLTNATAEGFLSISPDGKWLAYRHVATQPEAKGEELTLRIGLQSAEGNAEPRLFDLPMRRPIIHWTADSTAFDYAAGSFNSSSLWRLSVAGGEPQKLAEFPDRIYNFVWSGDRKILMSHAADNRATPY